MHFIREKIFGIGRVAAIVVSLALLSCTLAPAEQSADPLTRRWIDAASEKLLVFDFEAALETLALIDNEKLKSAEVEIMRAEALDGLGRGVDALDYYARAAALDPDREGLAIVMGTVAFDNSLWEQAVKHLRRALQSKPDSILILNTLGRSFQAMSEFEEARQYFKTALELDETRAESHLNIGLLFNKMERYREAADALEIAVSLEPQSDVALNSLSFAYFKQGKYVEATLAMDAAVSLNPDSVLLKRNRAFLSENVGEVVELGGPPRRDAGEANDKKGNSRKESETEISIVSEETEVPEGSLSKEPEKEIEKETAEKASPCTGDLMGRAVEAGESAAGDASPPPETNEPPPGEKETARDESTETAVDDKPESTENAEIGDARDSQVVSAASGANKNATDTIRSEILPALPLNAYDGVISEKLDLQKVEGQLSPLPLPSEGLGREIVLIGPPPLMKVKEFSFAELAELRRKVEGTLVYEDQDHWIWSYRPASRAARRLFKGSQPCASADGKRILFIDWDLREVGLYLFEASTSLRAKLFQTPNPLKQPRFSPDGRYVSVVEISSAMKPGLRVISLADASIVASTGKLDFSYYAWDPSDNTIILIPKDCPPEFSGGSLCYARLDPENASVKYGRYEFEEAETGRVASFRHFRSPVVEFAPGGARMLVYDSVSGVRKFFIVDVKSGTVEKRAFTKPGGDEIQLRNLTWGIDDQTLAFTHMSKGWISLGREGPVFPVVVSQFIGSRVSWRK